MERYLGISAQTLSGQIIFLNVVDERFPPLLTDNIEKTRVLPVRSLTITNKNVAYLRVKKQIFTIVKTY